MSKRKPTPTAAQVRERKRFWQTITRDLVLFVTGLLLFIYEAAIRSGDPRESILFMEAGMMGLGAIFRLDEFRRRNGNGSSGDSE